MGVHCCPISPPHFLCSLSLPCYSFFFLPFVIHLFAYFLSSFLISLNPSSYLPTPLLFFPLTLNLPSPVSQSHFLPLLSTSLPLSASIPFIINTLLNVFFHIFSLFLSLFHSCVHQFYLTPSHSFFISTIGPTYRLSSPFLPILSPFVSLLFLLLYFSPSDPEQNVYELMYDLRSQCDAIRVTKTVRPYRMVICPVNENNAALMVSDGRAMLWELKAHTGRAVVNPRYTHTLHFFRWWQK